jgi:hypothetical protein
MLRVFISVRGGRSWWNGSWYGPVRVAVNMIRTFRFHKKSCKFLEQLRDYQLVTTILLPAFHHFASVSRNHLHFTLFCKYTFKFVVSEKRFYALTLTSLEYPNCSKQNQTYVFFGKKVASLRAVKTSTPSTTCKEVNKNHFPVYISRASWNTWSKNL